MNNSLETNFDGPATYQISVSGAISTRLENRLGGMFISINAKARPAVSTLTGELMDQAALSGVLNTLFDHRLIVISVLKL